ncbi:hypothetical protein MMC14_010760 [Varicellaria rhodocarpa]|nr:hypothetical protein [Varicellaria rhodocarpa]
MHPQEYKAKGIDLSNAFADWEPITDVKGSVIEDVKKLRDLPMVRVVCGVIEVALGDLSLEGAQHTFVLSASLMCSTVPVAFVSQVRDDVAIYGFAYDVNTGELEEVTHDPAKTGNQQ